jgi:hypothetical protein
MRSLLSLDELWTALPNLGFFSLLASTSSGSFFLAFLAATARSLTNSCSLAATAFVLDIELQEEEEIEVMKTEFNLITCFYSSKRD